VTELSIVLITKNQAWNIPRLIGSVLQATSLFPSREIVLVDSNSTDETVKFASRYPINVVRLRPGSVFLLRLGDTLVTSAREESSSSFWTATSNYFRVGWGKPSKSCEKYPRLA